MTEAIIVSAISLLVDQLGSGAYQNIMFAGDLDSHIKRLQQLKTTMEATILDARSLDSCTNAQKDLLEKLDCALSDLDYFLDATSTRAKKREIMHGNKFIKQVRLFFSKSNQLVSLIRESHKLKAIIEQFESISRDQALVRDIVRVPSVNRAQMMIPRSLWSACHILTEEVIGRDKDRDNIISMLFDDSPSSQQTFSVTSIVGIGGVGKTTLAKYVYHDEKVKNVFDLRLWVSTTQDFDVHKVLLNILATLEDEMPAKCDIVQTYDCFKRAICGKKFFLVLDNVWDQENLWHKWQDVKSMLVLGATGSKVLLTTRDKKVARIMGCVYPYVLGDLTKVNSWLLFQNIAFTQCQDADFKEIGREIVNMCPDVPLVIRSTGGLLAGKCTIMEWLAFRDDQLAKFLAYGHDIMQMLKLSYDQLDERLKLCVAYCSLFPKGHVYNKDDMIRLWISLGYIKPSYEGQHLEDAAEECILKLTFQGFFFIDFEADTSEIEYLSMHNLMHELLLYIVDFKYKMVRDEEREFDERVRHLSLVRSESKTESSTKVLSSIFKLKKLQSLLVLNMHMLSEWSKLWISKKAFYVFQRIRILSLSHLGIEKVPISLGELITLRYLNLSANPITSLPNSIKQLVELLSLDVSFCSLLNEFPKGLRKLVKLRHLRNKGCPALIPKEVASLTNLQTLDEFRLELSKGFPRETDCGLAELNSFINCLIGKIRVIFNGDAIFRSFKANDEHRESKGKLVYLLLDFREGSIKGDEMVMKALLPNTNLREIGIEGYKGERLPKWMNDGSHCFKNLVAIFFWKFECCRSFGSFGRLLHLKQLLLECSFPEVVRYIEEYCCGGIDAHALLFPSLEYLWLLGMPKLTKWYEVSNGESSSSSSVQHNVLLAPMLGFPKLQQLVATNIEIVISMAREFKGFSSLESITITDCENVKVVPNGIPNISHLKELRFFKCCEELKQRCREPIGEDWPIIKHIAYLNIS